MEEAVMIVTKEDI